MGGTWKAEGGWPTPNPRALLHCNRFGREPPDQAAASKCERMLRASTQVNMNDKRLAIGPSWIRRPTRNEVARQRLTGHDVCLLA